MDKHLRGRVRIIGYTSNSGRTWRRTSRPVYEWSVVNTTTGEIVARDDMCCTMSEACDQAIRLTEICRVTLIMGIRLKRLREK